MNTVTAEQLFQALQAMPMEERVRFFSLLAINAFRDQHAYQNLQDQQVFWHLDNDEFTAQEAADYLEVSIGTFRRYVYDGRIKPCSAPGITQLFATRNLKAFKHATHDVKLTLDGGKGKGKPN
ncbi:helix-turn-helix domain-containing protein [Glaciimonas sp. PCH181]|uniref:helix-turn-helix domain-containing protein n=1 Tax=Glaciimonas sp. PCH181 TaxID=2133943 RepID=UPI000D34CE8D|nr:helix-turn-helix domain-containing protein [Glaciimonas sp. PCH181]PUA16840.1 DNA-binding protein [Glaciimonas sp. PCH181]